MGNCLGKTKNTGRKIPSFNYSVKKPQTIGKTNVALVVERKISRDFFPVVFSRPFCAEAKVRASPYTYESQYIKLLANNMQVICACIIRLCFL